MINKKQNITFPPGVEVIWANNEFIVLAFGLAKALGYRDEAELLEYLPASSHGSFVVDTPDAQHTVLYLTEPGFYQAMFQRAGDDIPDPGAREAAKKFQDWVVGMLSSLNCDGSYSLSKTGPRYVLQEGNPMDILTDEFGIPRSKREA